MSLFARLVRPLLFSLPVLFQRPVLVYLCQLLLKFLVLFHFQQLKGGGNLSARVVARRQRFLSQAKQEDPFRQTLVLICNAIHGT
jgi:hypothetical protein